MGQYRAPAVLVFAAIVLAGQRPAITPVAPPERRGPATLRVSSDLVLVPTIVTTKDYRPVFDLKQDQFRLRVDNADASIDGFWQDTGPVSVVIVLDSSGSMRGVLQRSKEALNGFFKLAHPEDEYALVLCQERGRVDVPFTANRESISAAMRNSTAKGSTPLFDSLELALELVKRGRHERRAILVISDGEDTSSHTRFKELRSRVLESNAYLYVIQFWTGCCADDVPRFGSLRDLAELTGGVFYNDVSAKRFAAYIADLDLHRRYILAFRPRDSMGDHRRHRVDIKLNDVDLPKPRVFWRHSYADLDPSQVR